jgi:uncharacterized repeat protein (TIGR01451 family)
VQKGDQIDYTITVKNDGALPLKGQTLVDTLPVGAKLVTGSVNPTGDTSVAGKITWIFDLDGFSSKTFTYKVDVTADFGTKELKNTAQWRNLSASTTHPVKAINVTVGSICEADTPFYSIKVESQNLPDQPVKVEWLQANADGTLKLVDGKPVPATDAIPGSPTFGQPLVDSYPLTGGALNLPRNLWKGAVVENGKIVKWPGWLLNTDGSWTQIPDGGVRPATVLRITVNPTVDSAALYPPAAPDCNANPPTVPVLDKSANPTEGTAVTVGQAITYTVVVSNKGGRDLTGPVVDTIPAGFDVDSISDGGTLTDGRITWNVTLAPGASRTFTYTGTVTGAAADTLVNTVAFAGLTDSTSHPVSVVSPEEDVIDDEEVVAGEEIADTGADNVGTLVSTALLVMVLGGLMVTFDRRRRTDR